MLTDFLLRASNPICYAVIADVYTVYPCAVLFEKPNQLVVLSLHENKGYIISSEDVKDRLTKEEAYRKLQDLLGWSTL